MMAWTRRHTLIAGLSLILVVNAIALGGVAYNRSGESESRLQLSQRELRAPYGRFNRSENSGVELALAWRVPLDEDTFQKNYALQGYETWGGSPAWLNQVKLLALGFELPPEERGTFSDRKWQRTKEVLLVLEFDGPSTRRALEYAQRKAGDEEKLREANPGNKEFERRSKAAGETLQREERENSRLLAIDAGLDVGALRATYPDKSRHLIMRAHVRPMYLGHNRQERIAGHISALSVAKINVPVEFQTALEGAATGDNKLQFNATVAWGQRLEPWLVAIAKQK